MNRRFVSFLLSVSLLLSLLPPARAAEIVASGGCGAASAEDLVWTLYSDGLLTFLGSGAMRDYGIVNGATYTYGGQTQTAAYTEAPWYSYRDRISSVIIPYGVTHIGNNAFYGNPVRDNAPDYRFGNLTSVTLESSTASVGAFAFARCTALTDINFQEGLESIGESAFADCTALESCTLPESLSQIGNNAFSGCDALTLRVSSGSAAHRYVQLNNLRHSVIGGDGGSVASGVCGAVRPENLLWSLSADGVLTFSGSGAMTDFSTIRGASYGSRVASYTSAPWFPYKDQISAVVVPDGVTSVGAYAFFGNADQEGAPDYRFGNLARVTLAGSVRTIGNNAFGRCPGLTEIQIPDGVSAIGDGAFRDCTGLRDVILSETVTSVGANAFNGCTGLTEVLISENVGTIGDNAFANCPALTLAVFALSYAQRWAIASGVSCQVVEYGTADVTGVTVEPAALTLAAGSSAALTATVKPRYARDTGVTWQSLNESVATVNDSGVVTGVSAGTAQIMALTRQGQKTAFCTVTVTARIPVTGVTLNRSRLGLQPGGSARLTASVLPETATDRTVLWSSSNPAVVTVDAGGMVSMISGGTAVITAATADGGFTASCTVSLPVTASGILMDKNALALKPGGSARLTASVLPETATNPDVSWSSSNPGLVRVSSDGEVTAGLTPGKATVIAISHDGNFTALCLVTVLEEVVNVTGVRLSPTTVSDLSAGTSVALTASVLPETATNRALSWASTNPDVAVVSGNGVVTAVAAGTAVITATAADGGWRADCVVTVPAPGRAPDRIEVDAPDNLVMVQGLPLNIPPEFAVRAVYGSSREPVTEYTLTGYDRNRLGTQTVTVAYRGRTAGFSVTVVERRVEHLTILQSPARLNYVRGDRLDLTGLLLRAEYNDQTTEQADLRAVTVSGFDAALTGRQSVTVSFGGQTASFPVNVRPPAEETGVDAPRMSIFTAPGGKRVELTAAQEAAIYYTTDGSVPTAASRRYTAPLDITADTTVKAVAVLDGVASPATSGQVRVERAAAPAASEDDGSLLPMGTLVLLGSATPGAAIYYTTDGSTPTTDSLRYGSGILVGRDVTIKAVAVMDGYRDSEPLTVSYRTARNQSNGQTAATLSFGSVTSMAGDSLSAPVYIFTEGTEQVTDFRFTIRFDREMFDFASVTPAGDMDASLLMVSSDYANGVVTVRYDGSELPSGGMTGGEMFTLNLNALASAVDGVYELGVTDAAMVVKTDAGTPLVSVTSGVITLLGSDNSQLTGSVTFRDRTEQEVTRLGGASDLSATFELDPCRGQDGGAVMADVFLAIYDRQGRLWSLESWNVSLSNVATVFMQSIRIPVNVDVGRIKLMILSEDMTPLMAASGLSGPA